MTDSPTPSDVDAKVLADHQRHVLALKASARHLEGSLRLEAADRDDHAFYLACLLNAPDEDAREEVVPPKGCPAGAADALLDDVSWVRRDFDALEPGAMVPEYPGAYHQWRTRQARRRRARPGPSIIRLDGRE